MDNYFSDPQFGEFGEQEVRARLERALYGTGVQFSGFSDKGIDLILQFVSPAPDSQPLHFGVQVKTGNSFTDDANSHWKVKNVNKKRFNQWKTSRLPILFVWVHPNNPAECYWQFVRRNTNPNQFLISKKAVIAPSVRYDFAMEYFTPPPIPQNTEHRILRPPLAIGLRPYAKEFYHSVLMPTESMHSLLGNIKFTAHP